VRILKILLLGIAFILAGIAFLSFPESYAAIFIAGIACETLGLLLAVIGAVKKEPKDSL
jgi:multisubunit Na+/H+ antiporter MnhG subunit